MNKIYKLEISEGNLTDDPIWFAELIFEPKINIGDIITLCENLRISDNCPNLHTSLKDILNTDDYGNIEITVIEKSSDAPIILNGIEIYKIHLAVTAKCHPNDNWYK